MVLVGVGEPMVGEPVGVPVAPGRVCVRVGVGVKRPGVLLSSPQATARAAKAAMRAITRSFSFIIFSSMACLSHCLWRKEQIYPV